MKIKTLLLSLIAVMQLAGTKAANTDWVEGVFQIRQFVDQGKTAGRAPAFSKVMYYNEAPELLSYDVTGLEKIVISTNGTLDGSGWDHAVYGNPRLITASGEVVSLLDLKPSKVNVSNKDYPIYNKNINDEKLSIAGKVYDKAIIIHANGSVEYTLDGKYVRFESEVGVDNGSIAEASVYFKVKDAKFSEQYVMKQLDEKHNEGLNAFNKLTKTTPEMLLFATDGSVERAAVMNMASKFGSTKSIERALERLDGRSATDRMKGIVELAYLLQEVQLLNEKFQFISAENITAYMEDMKGNKDFDYAKYEPLYKEVLEKLAVIKPALNNAEVEYMDDAEVFLKLHKKLMAANPVLDPDRVIVARFNLGDNARKAMAVSIGAASANYRSMFNTTRTGVDAEIAELSNLGGDVQIKTVYKPTRNVNIADLQMDWDAERLLFTSVNDKNKWKIYQVNVDGSNHHQLFDLEEQDVEFCDANFLPDGRYILSSNIGYNGVPCVHGTDIVGNMALYDPETGSFRRLTFDQEGNWSPTVKHDGKVMYTRWEYTDLTHYFSRIVMQMNPDGTDNRAYYGSGSFFPNSTFDMKPLPNSDSKFIAIISGHHGVARSGRLVIFDPSKSKKEEKGMVQELPFKDREIEPIIIDRMVDGVWPQFIRPQAIDDNYFLVSAKLSPESLWGIYLVDVYDNLTCLAEFEGEGFNSPILVTKTKTPPVIKDRVNLEDKEATIFIQDIYSGEGTEDLPKGVVKELRIFAYEYAYRSSSSNFDVLGIQSGWDIKRLLGTVPVEEDGSAVFKVPASTPISIQPVDSEGRAVQWMRSWFTPQPGEVVSCIGCHEDLMQVPIPKRVIASTIKPHELTLPEGGVRPFTFDLEIQPILDRACIACHNEKSKINLVHGMDLDYPGANTNPMSQEHTYSTSYLQIMPYICRQGPEADMYVMEPYEYHASNSELVRILKSGHHGVELTDKEWRTIYNWIDFNAPDRGIFSNIKKNGGYEQYERRIFLADKYNNGAGVEWQQELADYTAYLKAQGPIEAVMPAKSTQKVAKSKALKGWPFSEAEAKAMQSEKGETTKSVEIAPGIVIEFVWVPAGSFISGKNGNTFALDEAKSKVDKGFWMSKTEITNEQYTTLVPTHDSRVIGQFWKDHVHAGYWANLPQQPVIRVSLDDALDYVQMLAKNHNLRFDIPTEIEWEWACRGGSDTDMWFGDMNSDFGKYDNLADVQLSQMAVKGLDPKPMPANDPLRKYWDFIPKISSVDDGVMISGTVGTYESNAWGLIDMHGNVAEWTSSNYGDESDADLAVVRGGSWMDRPKFATAYTRKSYYPWQRSYNVGFRLIIRE